MLRNSLENSRDLVRNREEKIDRNFLEKIFSRENLCEKWRKTFLEKNLVKNGEKYMVDTTSSHEYRAHHHAIDEFADPDLLGGEYDSGGVS